MTESKKVTLTTPEGFVASQLTDTIWSIDDGMVRCFLVVGSDAALLIDSGVTRGSALSHLVSSLTNKPVTLVFTHTDGDHTGGQEFFGTPLLHPAEYDYYVSKGNEGREVKPLWEGDILTLGGIDLEVLLLPGHTPGSLAFFDRKGQQIFVGDTISDAWIYMFNAGRNLKAIIESLRKLEDLSDSIKVVYACHGSATLGVEWVAKTKIAAQKLLAGELTGKEPPRDLPCQAYTYDGVTFYYP